MKKQILDFLATHPNLKIFLTGTAFFAGALGLLLTLLFSCHGPENIFEDMASAFFWSIGLGLIVSSIAVGCTFFDKL